MWASAARTTILFVRPRSERCPGGRRVSTRAVPPPKLQVQEAGEWPDRFPFNLADSRLFHAPCPDHPQLRSVRRVAPPCFPASPSWRCSASPGAARATSAAPPAAARTRTLPPSSRASPVARATPRRRLTLTTLRSVSRRGGVLPRVWPVGVLGSLSQAIAPQCQRPVGEAPLPSLGPLHRAPLTTPDRLAGPSPLPPPVLPYPPTRLICGAGILPAIVAPCLRGCRTPRSSPG